MFYVSHHSIQYLCYYIFNTYMFAFFLDYRYLVLSKTLVLNVRIKICLFNLFYKLFGGIFSGGLIFQHPCNVLGVERVPDS